MTSRTSGIAINPLPWILDATTGFHLDRESLTSAFEIVSEIGFVAVQADIPNGFSPAEYLEFIASYGLRPAPSYFGADFDNVGDLPDILDRARAHAAMQVQLGNDMTFIAGNLVADRRARPAVGAAFDQDRLDAFISGLAAAAAVFTDAGLTPGLHPHVGSVIETENEIRAALDGIPSAVLGFGPDTGHLAWAGMKPETIMSDYSDRIVGVHIKDVDAHAAEAARQSRADYTTATETLHVWTEPGDGMVDFDRVLASLPASIRGGFTLEVDVPNNGDAEASTRRSASWIAAHPQFDGSLR